MGSLSKAEKTIDKTIIDLKKAKEVIEESRRVIKEKNKNGYKEDGPIRWEILMTKIFEENKLKKEKSDRLELAKIVIKESIRLNRKGQRENMAKGQKFIEMGYRVGLRKALEILEE